MKYPQRPKQHVMESESFKVFESWVPSKWIIRQVTERDYGIDVFVELVKENNDVPGELIAIQLKSTETQKYHDASRNKSWKYSGIDISTVNYWNNLAIPSFVFLVLTETKDLYFAPVKHQIRKRHSEYTSQTTFAFEMTEVCSSKNPESNIHFLAHYFQEKNRIRIEEYIRLILVHWKYYLRFLQEQLGRDYHLGVDEFPEFVNVYRTIQTAAVLLSVKWTPAKLSEMLEHSKRHFGNEYYDLYSGTMDEYVPEIEKSFFEVFNLIRSIVVESESDYWKKRNPFLYATAQRLNNVNYENRTKFDLYF